VNRLRWMSLVAVALVVCVAPAAGAKPPGGAVISPVHRAAGMPGGELLADNWVTDLSNPAGTFAGGCMLLGNDDRVAFPAIDENLAATCTVKPGTPVFIAPGSECSDVEDPPFFGATAAEQRACAIAVDQDFFLSATISVDGGKPVEIIAPRFELVSPQTTVDLAPDNTLGVPPQTATFVAHGWGAMVRGLSPGTHTITADVATSDGAVSTVVFTIHVVPRGHAR